jgi:intein-encoded DNA endonuclease-like protein
LYEWDEEEIVNLYHQEKSARKVAKTIRCDHSTIDAILNKNNVKRYSTAD